MGATKHSLAVACCVLAMGMGHLAFAADETAGARTDALVIVDNEVSLEAAVEHEASFDGPGKFVLLDNGVVILRTGGEWLSNPRTNETVLTHLESVSFRLVDEGLSLVNYDGKMFLDNNGRRTRDLDPTQFTTTRIATEDRGQTDRYSILSLKGQIGVDFDGDGRISISVRDMDRELFSIEFSEVAGRPLEVANEADARNAGWTATCSVTCSNGSCNISCTDKKAQCYCDGTTPVCECVKRPKVVSMEE